VTRKGKEEEEERYIGSGDFPTILILFFKVEKFQPFKTF